MIQLTELLALHRTGQSDFQNEYFVTIRAGGTPYGCFVQALRELWKRFRGLRDDLANQELLRIDIAELAQRPRDGSFDAQRAAVAETQKRRALIECEKQIENDRASFLQFYSQAAALYVHLGFDREPPTPERLQTLEAERWEHNILCGIAADYMVGMPPQKNACALIQCCPPAMRQRILRRAFGPNFNDQDARLRYTQTLVDWFLNYTPDIPVPMTLTEAESRRLVESCSSLDLPELLRISSATAAVA